MFHVPAALALALLAVATLAPSQESLSRPVHQPRRRTSPVEVDGNLREWRSYPYLELRERQQVIVRDGESESMGWQGPDEDLSAKIYVAWTPTDLYFAGRVVDQIVVPPPEGGPFWGGDAVEIFLDTDLTDDRDLPQTERAIPDQDDYQVFLLPRNPSRPWGVVSFEEGSGAGPPLVKLTDRGWIGVQVAFQILRDGYTFEMRLPLHNLKGLRPGAGEIGFNVAIGDHDPPEQKYTYMVWTGEPEPYRDARRRGKLTLEPGVILRSEESGGPGLGALLLGFLETLLFPLLLLAALALAHQVDRRLLRGRPRFRRGAILASLLLVGGGLFLPALLSGLRKARIEGSLGERAERLREKVGAMSGGALGAYRGTLRDGPLLDLLAGKSVKVVPAYRHEPIDLGPEPVQFPGGHLVKPHAIPLPGSSGMDQRGREQGTGPLSLEFREALQGGVAWLTCSYAQPRGTVFFSPFPQVGIRLTGLAGSEGGWGPERSLDLGAPVGEQELFGEKGDPSRLAAFVAVPLPREGIRGMQVRALIGEEMRLEGVTWSGPDEVGLGRPLALGRATLSGIPTSLYGSYPRRAGEVIGPGKEKTWPLSASPFGRGWDRAWLILSAGPDRRAFSRLGPGDPAALVRFSTRTGKTIEWTLDHQNHVFSELAQENDRLESLQSGEASAEIAFRWIASPSPGEQRISVVATTELAGAPDLSALTVVNRAPYPIHVWDLILGIRRALAPSEPEGSPLRLSPEGESFEAREDIRSLAEGIEFAVIRDESPARRATRPDGGVVVRSGRAAGDVVLFRAQFPLKGEGWGDAALELVVRDGGLALFQRVAALLGLLIAIFALPLLFVFAVEGLISLRTLRAKLLGSLALAAAVPLVLFSLFLVQVLEGGHEEREQERLLEELRGVSNQLEKEKARLEGECFDRLASLMHTLEATASQGGGSAPADREALRQTLARELARMRPAEWSPEAFLRLDLGYLPDRGALDLPLVVYDREESRFLGEVVTPMRKATYQVRWGVPFLSVRTTVDFQQEGVTRGGAASLTLGVPIDARLLEGIVGRSSLILCDPAGYPLVWAQGGGPEALTDVELKQENDRARMEGKRRVLERLVEGKPVSGNLLGEERVGAFEVLRDSTARSRPLLLLGVLDRSRAPVLSLASLGLVGVGRFFGAAGGAILVLVLFVGWVVTDRVSRPLERLREGTGRLSKGELGVRVPVSGVDEIAELAEAFNRMAAQLQARVRDAERLNQALREFTSRLDLAEVCVAVSSFLVDVVAPARVLVVVGDRAEEPLVVDSRLGAAVRLSCQEEPFLSLVLGTEVRTVLPFPQGRGSLVGPRERVLVVPLRPGGRPLGGLAILAEGELPALNPHFLDSLAGQIGVAMENARLFHLAIEDPLTGAFVSTYFRERLGQEVDRARRSDRPLSLVRLSLESLEEVAASRGPVVAGAAASAVALRIRHILGERPFLLGWLGRSDYEILFPETTRQSASALARELHQDLESHPLDVGSGDPLFLRVAYGVVSCPEDAESAEFLADEAERALVRARKRGGPLDAGPGLDPGLLRVATPVISVGEQEIVVKSAKMRELFSTLERVVSTNLTVLLQGETGVGKEVFTDLIHQLSDRAGRPLVKVNCSAFPETLLESELFGHEKGAFTGATGRKHGRFELAGGGTLFLDEVGEMSLALQVKLLRFLQDRCIERLGGGEPIPVDVRIVAATNRDLGRAIQEGIFREDLYFRLKVVSLEIPPLRERKEDIPHLVEIFRKKFIQESGKHIAGLSADAMDRLHHHQWPGNVRELRNVLTRAMYLANGEVVEAADLTLPASAAKARPKRSAPPPEPASWGDLPPRLDRMLQMIQERGALTAREAAQLTGSPLRTCSRNLAELVQLGLVVATGDKKGRVYRVVREGPMA